MQTYASERGGSINAADFGLYADGVHDDSAGLQEAINWASKRATSLYIPPAIYLAKSQILLPSNFRVSGSGKQSTVFLVDGSFNCFLADSVSNVSVSDMGFQGVSAGTYPTAVGFFSSQTCKMKNLSASSFGGNAFTVASSQSADILDCDGFNCSTSPVWIGQIGGGTGGTASSSVRVRGGTFINNQDGGVILDNAQHVSISEGLYDQNYGGGAIFSNQNAGWVAVKNNLIRRTGGTGQGGDNGIELGSANSHVIGNTVTECDQWGIVLTDADNSVISGNYVANNGQANNGVAGIQINGCHYVVIAGNAAMDTQTTPTQGYGIVEEANGATTTDYNTIAGNTIRGNVYGAVYAKGLHTQVSDNAGYNPVGPVGPPAIPASGTAVQNTYTCRARVFVSGGTVTNIEINGSLTGLTSGSFSLDPGETITLIYSAAPSWTWLGL